MVKVLRQEALQAGQLHRIAERDHVAELRVTIITGEEAQRALDAISEQWDAALDANASDADREAILQRLNELLNRRSYIRNLVAGVEKELAESGAGS